MVRRALISKKVGQLLKDGSISVPPVDVESLAKSLGLQVLYHPFSDGSEDISGCIIQEQGIVAIGVNSSHHPNRQRFTVAHEMGHYVLHRATLESVHLTRDFRSSEGDDDREIEANSFAAELLMPEEMIRERINNAELDVESASKLTQLARTFGVSQQAMTIRLVRLGILQET